MKKLAFLSAVFFISLSNAQIVTGTSVGTSSNKWTYGGGATIGVSGGSGWIGTTIGVSPRVGYMLTNNLETGVSGSFLWSNSKYYSTTTFGIGPFANYYISRNFFVSALFQEYFYTQKNKFYNQKVSGDEAALFLGAGYMQRIGTGAYMQIGASYNVLYKEGRSIFGGGFVPSVGVVFGL